MVKTSNFGLILAFIIGFQIFSVLYQICAAALFQLIDLVVGLMFYTRPDLLFWLNLLLLFIIGIFGGIHGLKSYKEKNVFYKIWRPTKRVLVANLIITTILTIAFHWSKLFSFSIIVELFIGYLLAYTFSAMLLYLFHNYRKEKAKWLILFILLMVLLFPMIVNFSAYIINLHTSIDSSICGVYIADISQKSS